MHQLAVLLEIHKLSGLLAQAVLPHHHFQQNYEHF